MMSEKKMLKKFYCRGTKIPFFLDERLWYVPIRAKTLQWAYMSRILVQTGNVVLQQV